MSFVLPPIVKLAERLLVDVDNAVRRFARYHRFQVGADLRRQAMEIAKLADRARRDRARRATWVAQLVRAIDDFKIILQLGQLVRAFNSFGQFEAFARLVRDLGKQAGAWHRAQQQHPTTQNAVPT